MGIAPAAALLAAITAQAVAQNKSGVSPTTISRPSGPGSLEGLGEAFQPALNTGTARYAYPIRLPRGTGMATPELVLRYDSGLGFGPAGLGWTFDVGSIRRQVDKGLPRYDDDGSGGEPPDRFLGTTGEELVPLAGGFFLAKVESRFTRYRRAGDMWEAHEKSGIHHEFGLSELGRLSSPEGTRTFEWCLERTTDTNGNTIDYTYERPSASDRQIYLSEIRYGPGTAPREHNYLVRLEYEQRPDPRTDYRPGFRVRTSWRLSRIDVFFDDQLIRRYELGYGAHPHWSLLTTITQLGSDGATSLPTTTFGYSAAILPDAAQPIPAASAVLTSIGEPGGVFDRPNVDLIDLNADGLPDLLSTELEHAAYLNRGVQEAVPGVPQLVWQGPLAVTAAEMSALSRDLAQSNIHLADMTGDGLSDLVITEANQVLFHENGGSADWGPVRLLSAQGAPPPSPFGEASSNVRTVDLDFDKRIDLLKSENGALTAWISEEDGEYSDATLLPGLYLGESAVDLSDVGVDLADVNGDRMMDVVVIGETAIHYFPGAGFGRFDEPATIPLPDRALSGAPGGNLFRAKMSDISGDGLADLVVERAEASDVWFWMNMGNGTFAASRVIAGLPFASEAAAVRWTDINGNGTTDLVYGDSSAFDGRIQAVDLGLLLFAAPNVNALTSIDNGYGRVTKIEYRSSTDHYLEAREAGDPWTSGVPFPVDVVSRTTTSIGLDLDGYPDEGTSGDRYITDYSYRDGYYDPLEKQFRGFAFVTKTEHGDERFGGARSPTLVTRMSFHTGAPDGIDNDGDGLIDEADPWAGREEEVLKGVEIWTERASLPAGTIAGGEFAPSEQVFDRTRQTWIARDLSTADGPLAEAFGEGYISNDAFGRTVRLAVSTKTETTIIERRTNDAEHKHLEVRKDVDAVGNALFEWGLGDLDNAEDDLFTGYEYATNEPAWIVDRVSRVKLSAGSAEGEFVSEERRYYDGTEFVGLPLGQTAARGNLHRVEQLISGGDVPPIEQRSLLRGDPRDQTGTVDVVRQAFDAFGNVIAILDANAEVDEFGNPGGNGHARLITLDDRMQRFPIRETILVGGGKPDLVTSASYSYLYEAPLTITGFSGHTTHFSHDALGRLETQRNPGDDAETPTLRYTYDWGAPVSATGTLARPQHGGSPDVITTDYFDGLGRPLGTLEAGGPVMRNVTLYNQRGTAWRTQQPYFGNASGPQRSWNPAIDESSATDMRYDELGRVVSSLLPADADGVRAAESTIYAPLSETRSDGEDNRTGGPHEATPRTLRFDGLSRLVEVREVEARSIADSGTFVTRYRYALPDLLAEIEDASGNIKYMRYDGLGREIFLSDCNRGRLTSTYDAQGNLISRTDAKQQRTEYTYDGVNRILTEDYIDDASELSAHRAPDVRYHYDEIDGDYPHRSNTRGQLSWTNDLTGSTFHSYDARGNLESVIKRIDQPDGSRIDYATVSLRDSLGREYQTVYPDGSVVTRSYDARGLLQTIPGFVASITYEPSALVASCETSSGTETANEYDPRLRRTRILTQTNEAVHQDLQYTYDLTSNVLQVHDARPLEANDPRNQSELLGYDDSYRLTQVAGAAYGTIDRDYDRLGNLVSQTSPDILDPGVHLDVMSFGGIDGTSNRVGRAPGDDPGPHALTSSAGTSPTNYAYDDNGNLVSRGEALLAYDFEDRLASYEISGSETRFFYDHTDRRVIKRTGDDQTSYICKTSEVRGDELINYVFAGEQRIARFEGRLPPPPNITQRIHLRAGWNLVSLQIDPAATSPDELFGSALSSVRALYRFDGENMIASDPAKEPASEITLAPGEGFWLLMEAPAEWTVTGSLAPIDQNGGSGLRLVGAPGLVSRSISGAGEPFPGAKAIWSYAGDEIGWRIAAPGEPPPVSNLTATAPGTGYWVEFGAGAVESPLEQTADAEIHFYHANLVHSTHVVTGAMGELISETAYYPFGTARHEFRAAGAESFDPNYRFGDKERDGESNLHYFEARYCATDLARFMSVDRSISRDPARYLETPQALHLYAYAMNNPMRYLDPTGNDPVPGAKEAKTAGAFSDMWGAISTFVTEQAAAAKTQAHPTLVPVQQTTKATKLAKHVKTVAPVAKWVGNALGGIGVALGGAEAVEGVQQGEADKVVGGTADSAVSLYGLLGGNFGVAFAGGYALGGLGAEQIDKHTSHYDRAVKKGQAAEHLTSRVTKNKTAQKVIGAATAGMESVLPGYTESTMAVLSLITD